MKAVFFSNTGLYRLGNQLDTGEVSGQSTQGLHPAIPKPRYSDGSLPLFGMEVFPHRKIDTVIPMVTRRHFETLLFRKITLRNGVVSNCFERPCHSEYILFLYAIAQLEMSIHAQFGDPLGQLVSQ